ncbi:hypothetical protein BDW42DRAFT_117351 [Aspergillus taichungensis]|uniref:Uncharacterized protein n=1 Tax=Aspergillus taichungensis TaxID=482145 RepID=A0A2J5HRS8_9EURO|nr:hypothetical protein BDW42DRAFT_117351 [Aspergillus taichungensis]
MIPCCYMRLSLSCFASFLLLFFSSWFPPILPILFFLFCFCKLILLFLLKIHDRQLHYFLPGGLLDGCRTRHKHPVNPQISVISENAISILLRSSSDPFEAVLDSCGPAGTDLRDLVAGSLCIGDVSIEAERRDSVVLCR